MASVKGNEITPLAVEQVFNVKPLREGFLKGAGSDAIVRFGKACSEFQRALDAVNSMLSRGKKKAVVMKQAYFRMDSEIPDLLLKIDNATTEIAELDRKMHGNRSKMEIQEKQPPTPGDRLSVARSGLTTTYGPTDLHRQSLQLGQSELAPIENALKILIDVTIPNLERELLKAGAPYMEGADAFIDQQYLYAD
jgi:hypothetical protein